MQFCYSGPTPIDICLIADSSLFPGQRIASHLHDCPGFCNVSAAGKSLPLQPPWLWGLAFVVDSGNRSPAAGVPCRVPEVTTQSHTCLDIRRAHTEYADWKVMVLPQETQATTRWSKTLQSRVLSVHACMHACTAYSRPMMPTAPETAVAVTSFRIPGPCNPPGVSQNPMTPSQHLPCCSKACCPSLERSKVVLGVLGCGLHGD